MSQGGIETGRCEILPATLSFFSSFFRACAWPSTGTTGLVLSASSSVVLMERSIVSMEHLLPSCYPWRVWNLTDRWNLPVIETMTLALAMVTPGMTTVNRKNPLYWLNDRLRPSDCRFGHATCLSVGLNLTANNVAFLCGYVHMDTLRIHWFAHMNPFGWTFLTLWHGFQLSHDRCNISWICTKNSQLLNFISIFGITMTIIYKWVQTSLHLVQWFL